MTHQTNGSGCVMSAPPLIMMPANVMAENNVSCVTQQQQQQTSQTSKLSLNDTSDKAAGANNKCQCYSVLDPFPTHPNLRYYSSFIYRYRHEHNKCL